MPTLVEATSTTAACAHCGLPAPAPADGVQAFCCPGCRSVYALIHEVGAEGFYRFRDGPTAPAETTDDDFERFDDARFRARYVQAAPDGTATVELHLTGVHCAACVWLVERLPRLHAGVIDARLEWTRGRARIRWDETATTLSAVARTLGRFGYVSHPLRDADGRARDAEDRDLLIRIAVAGASAGNAMLIAFALYGGAFHGMASEHSSFFCWASLAASLPGVVWGGSVFFRGAWAALRSGALHMDLPISIGIAVGFGASAVNTVRGAGDVWFDSVTALVFLLLCGRWLQHRRQRHAADATRVLLALAPPTARRREASGRVATVSIEAVDVGDRLVVAVDDTVPVDGRIAVGRSAIDRSLLTGESQPVAVAPGDAVHAGTVNRGAPIEIDVEHVGDATRLGKIARLVEEGARRRPRIVRLADRIAAWFAGGVLVAAAATVAAWWGVDPTAAIANAVALLVVTCPCALGLATPLAVGVALGRAASAGMLIKGGDVVERLARPGRVWLDKTGTLTTGDMRVVDFDGDPVALALAARLERDVSHPIARALAGADGAERFADATVDDVEATPGRGVRGTVDGRRVVVGAADWVLDGACGDDVERIARAGRTPIAIRIDGALAGIAAIGDVPRADAGDALARLTDAGWRVGILSGDRPEVVAAVGRTLGLAEDDLIGGATPEDKLARIEADAAAGSVVMVGDGVNDAAALAAATVGVAVHGGAEASLAAADAFLTRAGLAGVADLVDGARRTRRLIVRNIAFSIGYNAIGAALCAAGLVGPLVAAVLMPLSSLTVITNSVRARTFDEEPTCR